MDTLVTILMFLIVFALGASVGSFLNVVVYRLPAGLSILWPSSRCPRCLHKLGKRENVPILGWLWLEGRCHHCRTRISVRYPLVEALTGVLFLQIFSIFGFSVQSLGYWAFFSWLLALSLIDIDTMTLPNPLTQSGLVAGLVFQVTVGLLQVSGSVGVINQLMISIIGAVLGLWLIDCIGIVGSIVFGQAAMGGGDTKLAAMIGAWLGWKYVLLALILACMVGVFVGLGGRVFGSLKPLQRIVFGPFLALGAGLTVFWGETILTTYIRLFVPLS